MDGGGPGRTALPNIFQWVGQSVEVDFFQETLRISGRVSPPPDGSCAGLPCRAERRTQSSEFTNRARTER